MNTLLITAHPDPNSFSHALAERYLAGLHQGGEDHPTRVIDLATEQFDPVLRYGYHKRMQPNECIERSQESVVWANHIVIAAPVWWGTFPALFHGWVERVFTPGFAFEYEGLHPKPLLRGRTATLISSSMGPAFYTRALWTSPERFLRKRIFGTCGIKLNRSYLLGLMDGKYDTAARREAFAQRIERAGAAQATSPTSG